MPRFDKRHITQSVPILPFEIIEDIISDASKTLDPRSLSSIALTSHTFRIHANKSRFSDLIPYRKARRQDLNHTSRRITALADIIRRGHSFATMPGVCAFAKSFSLQLVGRIREVDEIINDGGIECIFNNLFRPSAVYIPGSQFATTVRSLSLYVHRENPIGHPSRQQDNYDGLDWDTVDRRLRQAFKDLLRLSRVNWLDLHNMRGVPPSVLLGSRFKHVCFRNVILRPAPPRNGHSNGVETRMGHTRGLESLDVDTVAPYLHLGHHLYSYLTKFSIDIDSETIIKDVSAVLKDAPSLRALTFRFVFYDEPEHLTPIHYVNLTNLESISFIFDRATPLSCLIQFLHSSIPRSLTDLRINFSFSSRFPTVESVIRDLEDFKIGTLDELLIHPSFDQITRIVINLEVALQGSYFPISVAPVMGPYHFASWRTYLARKVPLLVEKDRTRLVFHAKSKD